MENTDRLSSVLVIFLAITLLSSSATTFIVPVSALSPGSYIDDFVTAGSGGLNVPKNLVYGPDGNLYVLSFNSDSIKRYNGSTGAFMDIFVSSGSGGLNGPQGLDFAADGKLYVASELTDEILRYDSASGNFVDVFVTAGSGGMNNPQESTFGPDGNLYVTSYFTDEVYRYNGTDGSFIDTFVTAGSGGLDTPQGLEFGPDGNLYVVSENNPKVLRYDGATGIFIDNFATTGGGSSPKDLVFGPAGDLYVTLNTSDKIKRFDGATGSLVDVFVASGSGGLNSPQGLTFGPDDNLYVTSQSTNEILRYEGPFGIEIFCNGLSVTIEGTSGNDGLIGTAGDDVIAGLDGDDIIDGMGGNDTICGGLGDDVINGGAGDDWINAGDGNNTVHGEQGADNITAGIDDDFIYGGLGDDYINAGEGQNYVEGNQNDDFIFTGSGQDEIYGGNGIDIINAGDGQNYIEGNQQADTITSGSGDDDIYGGNGSDTINAGDGSNHVHGESGDDVITTGSGDDDIDGNNGDDCINSGVGTDTIDGGSGNNLINTGSCDFPPTIDISSPTDGDSFTGGTYITFSGTAIDPEDGDISNLITWDSSDDGFLGTGSSFTSSSLSVNSHVITATITDSFGNTNTHSESIHVTAPVDDIPAVTITSPADGDSFVNGTLVTLSGTAIDTEDGDISANITWTSDIYGVIGVGISVSSSTAPVGTHIITASVTDSFGNNASSSITMTITPEIVDEEPTVSISTPSDGDNFVNGTSITFSGSVTDPEDGGLSNNISWKSSIDGYLGMDSSVTNSSLAVGTHTITASVTDSGGNSDSDSILITINPAGFPTVTITSPTHDESYTAGTAVTFSGSATDPEDGGLSNSIIWNSSLDGYLGTGGPLTNSSLTIGTHTITATVSDIDGNSDSDLLTIEVTDASVITDEEEAEKKRILALVKKQQEETRNKNELAEKRQAFKEVKNELKDLRKIINEDKKQHIKGLVEDIKEVIQKLKEDPEYDKEHKKEIKDEIIKIKKEIVSDIKSDAKMSKSKINSKISELSKSDDPVYTANNLGLDFEGGKTQIAIELTGKDPAVVDLLSSIGKIDAKDDTHVQLTVNLDDLPKLRTIGGIDTIRPPFPAVQFEEELSEGVYFINADLAQYMGITGQGIKVAVLDLAFTDNPKISDNIVEVKSFRQGIGYLPVQGNDDDALHGTAVAEIITDVAPDVDLYLYSMETDIEFASAVDEAISQDVDIIVMSAGWPNFPTDGTSHITTKIEHAVDSGITFVVPAGNFANKHWEGDFVDSNSNNWHEFSTSDEGLTISVTEERVTQEKPIIAHLMWDVGMSDVADFELVLVDPLGQIVAYSADEQKTTSDTPFEYIYHAPEIDGIYSIGVLLGGDIPSLTDKPSATLEIFSVNDELEYPITKSSVSVPADADGAIVVGAVNHLDGTLEPFSSQGPTNNGKLAPHVVGPDGVTTLSLNGDPFFGTSATTPYIAGLAALIIQTNPDISPEQLLTEIQENTDSSLFSKQNEYDYSYGYGSASAIFLVEKPEVFE